MLAHVEKMDLRHVLAALAHVGREILGKEALGIVVEERMPQAVDLLRGVDHVAPDRDGAGDAHLARALKERNRLRKRDRLFKDGLERLQIEDRGAVRGDGVADAFELPQRLRDGEHVAPGRDRDGDASVDRLAQRLQSAGRNGVR